MKAYSVGLAAALVACSPGPVPAGAVIDQATAAIAPAGNPQTGLERMALTITSATGVHRFTVDIARTPEQQEYGLMFVRSLPGDRGMIFPYDPPQYVGFWMHNTLIPLDIIYISPDRTIGRIVNAKPLDETNLPSGGPVIAVLEIAGGRAAELGIKEGDKVDWEG